MPVPYEILFNLQDMFGEKGKSSRQGTLRPIMNTKITKGTLIRNHMIRMITLFKKIDIFGAKINYET